MITLSNGHAFQFVAASGALAFDGRGWPWEWPLRWFKILDPSLFTIVTKSLTLHPRRGNLRWWSPLRAVRLIPGGVVNAVGLTNPGIDWWIKKIYPKVQKSSWSFVASIAGEKPEEFVTMAEKLKSCTALKAVEINASCPNTEGELQKNANAVIETVKRIKTLLSIPLILKLSYTHDYVKIAQSLEGVVEAISINSVPWGVVFPSQSSPLKKWGGGGVSGQRAQPYTWKMVEELSNKTKIPVIGASVWHYRDLDALFEKGAKAVAFGSIFLKHPWRPTLCVKRWLRSA